MNMPAIVLDAWIDLGCPFCYVQLPVFDALSAHYGDVLEIRWHAFEVSPEPAPLFDPNWPRLLQVYADVILPLARERGLELNVPIKISRTRKGFEAAFAAREQGKFDLMFRMIVKAYFVDGEDIGSIDKLVDIAAMCGIAPEMIRSALVSGDFTDAVAADEALAGNFGVTGLPFVLVSMGTVASGSTQPVAIRGTAPIEHYHAAIDRMTRGEAKSGAASA